MTREREVVFELRDVTFGYPGFEPCLESVCLTVRGGERLALLGSNGSGKSTLLHVMDGLLFPTSGRASAFGVELARETLDGTPFGSSFRASVGLLFQNPDAMLFNQTVLEELAFGPRQVGFPESEVSRRCEDALELLDIGRLRDRSPGALSAGEQKRVALAALLTLSPSILLLDEPTAGLDPRSQSALTGLLDELCEMGLTLVTATHDLEAAEHLSERALVLGEDHRVAADGPAAEILADTELLLGANLIHAHRHRQGGALHSHPHRHH